MKGILGCFHTAPDKFSTGSVKNSCVWIGVPFTWNDLVYGLFDTKSFRYKFIQFRCK